MQIITAVVDGKSQVDRMWERLLEIALFFKTKQHRKPADILKSFISAGKQQERFAALSTPDIKKLRRLFQFLSKAYKDGHLADTPLAVDQTHFYTMITTLIAVDLRSQMTDDELIAKLTKFGRIFSGRLPLPKSKPFVKALMRYEDLSSDRTTDAPRRAERQEKFVAMLAEL